MTEDEIRPIAENYVEEYCYCSDGEYIDGSLVCAGIRTALIVSRQLEKRIAELEEKISILLSCKNCPENKGGYICEKEYEDKCLAQKIQYIKELKEENAELKKQVEQKQHLADVRLEQSLENYKLFSDERKARIDVDIALDDTTDQLSYAKTIIQDLLDNTDGYARQRAEDFLKENK